MAAGLSGVGSLYNRSAAVGSKGGSDANKPPTLGRVEGWDRIGLRFLRGRHCADEIIALSVRWYLRFPMSYRHLEELMAERSHTTVWR
jgi:hypothetical protein